MKKYKIFIRKYNLFKNKYETIEREVNTNDIYHEIGLIYSTTLEKIKRIDYIEIEDNMEKLVEQLKKKDEAIDECIKTIENFMDCIDEGFCSDMMSFIDILRDIKKFDD